MEKIYLPKELFEYYKEISERQLVWDLANWLHDINEETTGWELIQFIYGNSPYLPSEVIIKLFKGEIEILQQKEIKYRLYHEQVPERGLFKYHYFTKNAGLEETDHFEKIDILTKEEADELTDDMGEWLGEWLHEVED